MSMTYKETLDKAIRRGYLLARWGKRDAIEEEYYKWCKTNNIPLIKAYAGNKYAQFFIDLITTPYNFNDEGQKKIIALYRKYTRKPSSIGTSRGHCSVDEVPLEKLDTLVKELMPIYEVCKIAR